MSSTWKLSLNEAFEQLLDIRCIRVEDVIIFEQDPKKLIITKTTYQHIYILKASIILSE